MHQQHKSLEYEHEPRMRPRFDMMCSHCDVQMLTMVFAAAAAVVVANWVLKTAIAMFLALNHLSDYHSRIHIVLNGRRI